MLHAVLGLYIRALGSIDRVFLRSLQLKNEPAFGRATQPPFTHISIVVTKSMNWHKIMCWTII